jgi:hypothetical protein
MLMARLRRNARREPQRRAVDRRANSREANPMAPAVLRTLLTVLALAACAAPALAQQPEQRPASPIAPLFAPRPLTTPPALTDSGLVRLAATYGADAADIVRSGVVWRVFEERAESDGTHRLVAESADAQPALRIPNGDYIVHAAFGLAGATKRISVNGEETRERIALNAGGMKIIGMLGDAPLPASRMSLSVYVPDRGNAEAKLVAADLKAGETLRVPEGTYHVVSTLLEAPASGGSGGGAPTNSIIDADVRVQAGKLTEATLRHRAAIITLKLVNVAGGEALANTSFTVLTPGGDVIREMIGAFPSLPLAEGEYVVIARRDGKTHQATFTVQSTRGHDVEVLAK